MHTDYIGREERCRFIARRLIYWVAAVAVTGGAADATGIMDVVRAHANTAPFLARSASAPAPTALAPGTLQARVERRPEAFIALPAQPTPPRRKTVDAIKPDLVKPAAIEAAPVVTTPVRPTPVDTVSVRTPFEPVDVIPAKAESQKNEALKAEATALEAAPELAAATVLPQAEPVLSFGLDDYTDDAGEIESPVFALASATPFAPLELPAPTALSNFDPRFEQALTSMAMQHSALAAVGPGEEIPTEPYPRKQPAGAPAVVASVPQAAASIVAEPLSGRSNAVSAAVPLPVERPVVLLPSLADLPLPRPRPPLSPAQEMGLQGKERAKAENCLARAIYFEARNEPVRGQIAVAQVVLNRVFSPYYPDTICEVVYQNAHRRLSCQFTFACDGIPDVVRERGPWLRAQKIAKQALDAQVWLTDVAKSTHYHATYVRPYWIREMRRMVKHGQHIFYRPHRWGDGREEAGWGVASLTHSVKSRLAKN